jgi:hypothetical protein
MLKKLLLFFSIIIISGISAYFYFLSESRIMIRPYPYSVSDTNVSGLESAAKADVLILGDRMGKALEKESQILEQSTKLKLYNWSTNHEGIHRTLSKLKLLKKFPPIIVFHGASEELYEKKFHISDDEKIKKNFTVYENDKLISLIITFPILSKYYYKRLHYIDLNSKIIENIEIYSPKERLIQKQISFQLFNQEIKDLIELVKTNRSKLIFITTPINSLIAPKETCANSVTQNIQDAQSEIEKLLSLGQSKEAYADAVKLSAITTANANSFYLLGKAARSTGDLQVARIAFQKASVFDCRNWRGNAVYNAIILKEAKKNNLSVIDFDLEINSNEAIDSVFFDEIYPQNIYYQTLAKELSESINAIATALR